MATYFFDRITPEEALAYNPATDRLVFATGSGAQVSVSFTTQLVNGVLTLDLSFGGRTVTLSDAFRLETDTVFPDGSLLYAGSTGNDTQAGTNFADGLYGGLGNDSLTAGDGADLLQASGQPGQ